MRRPGARLRAALALAFALAPGAVRAQPPSDELAALHQAIEERRARVQAYERQEQGIFDAIEAVDAAARALAREVTRAEAAARDAAARLATLEEQRGVLEREVARTQALLNGRAVALYKAGEAGPLALVFAPGSLRDRILRINLLQRLFDQDQALLERARAERAALEQARVAAAEAATQRDQARATLVERRRDLDAERRGKRELLERTRRDQARERAVMNELEAAARELERTLAVIESTPAPAPAPGTAGFETQRGQLAPPVAGRLLRRFGKVIDSEYRTQTFQKGVDFAVTVGEPVYAVAAGEVRFADWFRGYGRMVILDHGDGYFTVNGHLDAIDVKVGQRLAAGDKIGSAGETGSLSGPRLYFEIRKGSEAIDPGQWLRMPAEP